MPGCYRFCTLLPECHSHVCFQDRRGFWNSIRHFDRRSNTCRDGCFYHTDQTWSRCAAKVCRVSLYGKGHNVVNSNFDLDKNGGFCCKILWRCWHTWERFSEGIGSGEGLLCSKGIYSWGDLYVCSLFLVHIGIHYPRATRLWSSTCTCQESCIWQASLSTLSAHDDTHECCNYHGKFGCPRSWGLACRRTPCSPCSCKV